MRLGFKITVNISSSGLRGGINPHKLELVTEDLGQSGLKISSTHPGLHSYKECIKGLFDNLNQHIERLEETYAIKRE